MKSIYKQIDKLSIDNLQELRNYIDLLIHKKESKNSWNSRVEISQLPIDYELKKKLSDLKINNMSEYKYAVEKGLTFSESLQEKADSLLHTFDFDKLEKNYRNRHK